MPVNTTTTTTAPGLAHRPRWRRPLAYATSVAAPPRRPRLILLRGSCGHLLGAGIVWHRQRYLAWKACR